MLKVLMQIGVIVAWLGGMTYAHSQQMTEMFIPVGQSPGVSNKSSLIGTMDSVDVKNRTVIVAAPSGARTVELTNRTKIWLDRSLLKAINQTGTFADLQKGHKVEVKLEQGERKQVAEWVKVQLTEPGARPGAAAQ
jgi:hypothetical protein